MPQISRRIIDSTVGQRRHLDFVGYSLTSFFEHSGALVNLLPDTDRGLGSSTVSAQGFSEFIIHLLAIPLGFWYRPDHDGAALITDVCSLYTAGRRIAAWRRTHPVSWELENRRFFSELSQTKERLT